VSRFHAAARQHKSIGAPAQNYAAQFTAETGGVSAIAAGTTPTQLYGGDSNRLANDDPEAREAYFHRVGDFVQ
jgi:hypothetical protein